MIRTEAHVWFSSLVSLWRCGCDWQARKCRREDRGEEDAEESEITDRGKGGNAKRRGGGERKKRRGTDNAEERKERQGGIKKARLEDALSHPRTTAHPLLRLWLVKTSTSEIEGWRCHLNSLILVYGRRKVYIYRTDR